MINSNVVRIPADLDAAGDKIIVRDGCCRFCGQLKRFYLQEEWDEERLNEEASKLCGCSDSKQYDYDCGRLEYARDTICEKFNDAYANQEARDLLCQLAEAVISEKIIRSIVSLPNGVKATISLTAHGNVKIRRTITEESSAEV